MKERRIIVPITMIAMSQYLRSDALKLIETPIMFYLRNMKIEAQFDVFTALIVAAIALLTVRIANARFRSERAMLVFRKVERDSRGDCKLTVCNIGRRAAFRITLCTADGVTLETHQGLAADEQFSVPLSGENGRRLELRLEYMDADLHRRCVSRFVVFDDVPRLEGASLPSSGRATWLRYGPVDLD